MHATRSACLALALTLPGAATAQFDSAAQVKPILQMIVPGWISVRAFGGQDLVYVTLLEVYRCGLDQIRYVINDGKPEVWETPPCEGDATFSDGSADRLPYAAFPPGSVERVRIELTYDDGTVQTEAYERAEVLQ